MRSIRLSLIEYVFLLFVLTLGAVLALLYRTTYQALQAGQKSSQDLRAVEADNRRNAVRDKFDDGILNRAHTLARLIQVQWIRRPRELAPLGCLSAALAPSGYCLVPAWVAESENLRLAESLQRQSFGQVQLLSDVPHHDKEAVGEDYYQISNEAGKDLRRSASLESHALPLRREMRKLGLMEWRFDEGMLIPGVRIRLVTMKVPVSRVRFNRGPVTSRPRPAPGVRDVFPTPVVFVEYGSPTCERDRQLSLIQKDLEDDLAALEADSETTVASLRRHIAWIGLAAFLTGAVGCCWLVSLGLAPLRRLSEAVSRVSEKDFRLPLDSSSLPAELRPICDRLGRTLEQLGRAFAREKQAAADISHELRTPLAALLTTIEVTLRKPRDKAHYQECLAECRTIGQQMTQMVERLLILARLDAGADQVRARQVDAADVAEESVALVRPLAEARGLALSLRRNGPAPVTTDPDKLREVMVNLLHNAVEYNRPQGRVEVRVARENGHVEVDVQDTGVGIEPEARQRIFERFYRADSSRQADTIHAGIGLSIVKGYVDLIGGRVWVDSKPGVGSTFHIRLPAN